jgi:ABC-2 type transport system ATP-binding protein
MTTRTALSIFGAVRGRDLVKAGSELAEKFALDMRVKVRDMSRGMRQKVGLILTLAHAPRLLVLDEPSTALDPLMQQILHQLLRQMAASGHTIFFSSHSLSEVEQLCDDVAIVRQGRLVARESLEALRQRAGHDVLIRWKRAEDAPQTEPPAFLKITRREGAEWYGVLDGPADALVDFLAGKPLEELNVTRPDLESLFRRYYERDDESLR